MLGNRNGNVHCNVNFKAACIGRNWLLIYLIAWLLALYLIWVFEHDPSEKIFGPSKRHSRQKRSGMIDKPGGPLELVPGRFWIYKRRENWHAAGKLCEADNRALATFPEKQDAKLVIDAIHRISHYSIEYETNKRKEEFGLDREYWMGLFDFGHEGRWEWLNNGFLTYQDMWTKGQPDHVNEKGDQLSGRPQHCVGLWNPVFYKNTAERPRKHTFDDKECTHTLYFLCGKAGEPKPPPIYDPPPYPNMNESKPAATTPVPPPHPPPASTTSAPTPKPTSAPTPKPTPKPTPAPPVDSCANTSCDNRFFAAQKNPDGTFVCKDGVLQCNPRTNCGKYCVDSQGRLLAAITKKNSNELWSCYQRYDCPDDIVKQIKEIIDKNGWKHEDAHADSAEGRTEEP